jgi:hypothetical protein
MATDSSYVTEKAVVAAPIATDDSASGPLTIQNPIAKLAIGTFAVLAAGTIPRLVAALGSLTLAARCSSASPTATSR